MAKALQIEWPESFPGTKLDPLGVGTFEDNATVFDAIDRLARWGHWEKPFGGKGLNRQHLDSLGPITLSFKQLEEKHGPR